MIKSIAAIGYLSVNYASGSKSPQPLLVDFLVVFHGCCAGFEGDSTLPIAGGVANNGGEDNDVDIGENVPLKLGRAGGDGIIGGVMGAGDIVGIVML